MSAAHVRGAIFAGVTTLAMIFSCSIVSAEPLALTAISASAAIDARGGGPILNIRLSDDSRKAFAAFSETHVGRPVDFQIDGKSVFKPVIREPITGGVFQITMNSLEDARRLAERFSQGSVKLEVEAGSN